ncbi:MAG: CBS domain-containing protein [Myxococcales bacterium]|nr:CBS domain-containing protein [Myxococcales bacterium]
MSRPMKTVRVADVMTRDVVAVAPDTSLATVINLLTQHRISGVPVVDGRGRAVGVVSLTDLVGSRRDVGESRGFPVFYRIEDGWAMPEIEPATPSRGRAEEVMTPLPFTIEATMAIEEAARVMVSHRVHRLLVTEDSLLVGIVSTLDLLRGFAGEVEILH